MGWGKGPTETNNQGCVGQSLRRRLRVHSFGTILAILILV